MDASNPLITNDAVVFGILAVLLAAVFTTASSDNPFWKKFYKYVPALLICYFLPGVLGTLGIISGEKSNIYFVASRYLLPACLVLLCLSIDFKEVIGLGPKALIMFLTGTFGIVVGGPIAYLIVGAISPETVGGEGADAVWRGMTTVAGSWIGGGANQTAMKEVFEVGDTVFSQMVTVDVIVANIWMAILLLMAGDSDKVDQKLKADNTAITKLQKKMEDFQASIAKIPSLTDLMKILGVAFGFTALAHAFSDILAPYFDKLGETVEVVSWMGLHSNFLWIVVFSTTGGLILSFTKFRNLEGAGASKVGSAFLYFLVASIGMKMDLMAIFDSPGIFLVGLIWISFHAILLLSMAKIIRAPTFFLAVGSQANVGGAASAPIVASAFHPTLAPVGVLLAVVGYFVGTFGAYGCGLILKALAGG